MTSDRSDQDPRSVVRRQELPEGITRPLATPLSPSVVFRAEDADALDAVYEGRAAGFSYAREGHPNASILADKLAWMEGLGPAQGQSGVVTASGMAAVSAVRLLAVHEPPLAQYAAVEGGVARIKGPLPPMIAAPTTAGTGSEVGRAAVIVMNDGRKLGVISPLLLPSIAVCDPALTYGLPPLLTAATGMDALAHCLETFMAPAVNPPADAIALDGLARGYNAIRRAVADGRDAGARWDMMMAALEGALAFQKGLGAVHALSHPLGALKGITLHHGTLNAVLLPAVLRFNRAAIGPKWDRLAVLLGGAPDEQIARLNRDLGLPAGLGAMGVSAVALPSIAAAAMQDHCHPTNPRRASEADYFALLQEAF